MDIVDCLPREIIEMILSYLPLAELLNASLVSKMWMQLIGSSEAFKRNSAINVYHWDWDRNKFPEIKRSCRNFEALNIKIFKCKDKDKSVLQNLLKCKDWRRVFFNVSKISSQKDFVGYIQKLEAVKELQVMNVQVRELKKHDKIVLKELESLAFSEIAIDCLYTFMAQQPSLKRLSLRFISSDILSNERSGQVIVGFLKLNCYVRELELHEDVTNDLFKRDITEDVKLNLRNLSIGLNDPDEDVKLNVASFLKSQQASLEQLELIIQQKFEVNNHYNWWEHEENPASESNDLTILFDAWNSMVSLKVLSLRFMKDRFSETDIPPSAYKSLNTNSSIKSLYVRHINHPHIQIKYILAIMNLCPNLKSLYISTLTPTVVRAAAYNLKLLRNISYMSEEDDAVNTYSTLKCEEGANKFINFSIAILG